MNPDLQTLLALRGQTVEIILGSIFLFVGIGALILAALRRRRQVGLLVWFGVFSALYGLRMLAQAPVAFALLPQSAWTSRPYVIAIITYLIFVPALLFWLELSIGKFRRIIQAAAVAAVIFAVVAVIAVLVTRRPFVLVNLNSEFAIAMMVLLGVVNAVPSWARKCLREPSRVLVAGTLILAVVTMVNNFGTFFPLPNFNRFEPLAFAVFVFSLGYVAAQRVFSRERRLVAIESELTVARAIQQSILPTSVPQLKHLRVAACYLPMASVAGDFYEFIDIDEHHAGFLVADVSGHGIPAALIASMLKVATHSASSHAAAPSDLMAALNQILSQQLRGQFVTAAYLYIDLQNRRALYSAAGHPPLLYWNSHLSRIQPIESNGLLFGVLKDTAYPEYELHFSPGDRLLLYTDGLVEAESSYGEAFGDRRLGDILSAHAQSTAEELQSAILDEFARWQSQSGTQQDDVTLIVIDLL
jgi:phosphoserine phosphatase RsbU/P